VQLNRREVNMEELNKIIYPLYFLVGLITFLILIIGGTFLFHHINGEKQVCHNEFVRNACYKVECTLSSCHNIEIDCNSNSVEKRESIYEIKCWWEKKRLKDISKVGLKENSKLNKRGVKK
jgi:hypothetical protein